MDRGKSELDIFYMKEALKEAEKAYLRGEVPVGAIIVDGQGEIISRGYNLKESKKDPTAHAEIVAIRKAVKKYNNWRLEDCTLYVTLEPCVMCYGAIVQSRIQKVVFGAYDKKFGVFGSTIDLNELNLFNHKVDAVGGILEEESSELLKKFFKNLRDFSNK